MPKRRDSPDLALRHLKRLQHQRNDTALLRARDRILRLNTMPRDDGEFWQLVKRFDEIVLDRRLDGSLQRYQLAREVLEDALKVLQAQEEDMS